MLNYVCHLSLGQLVFNCSLNISSNFTAPSFSQVLYIIAFLLAKV